MNNSTRDDQSSAMIRAGFRPSGSEADATWVRATLLDSMPYMGKQIDGKVLRSGTTAITEVKDGKVRLSVPDCDYVEDWLDMDEDGKAVFDDAVAGAASAQFQRQLSEAAALLVATQRISTEDTDTTVFEGVVSKHPAPRG